ncbi:hypothetical protein Hamer_G017516 [Homarus americanus]|uniref:Uncharacterized protein n=1 Tax=Homarus americanus TaxID=6706 RepID=A0A8J5MK26_HOMAM|nr:hypothetical protein Hamer_G017516 [Homarus americanus]
MGLRMGWCWQVPSPGCRKGGLLHVWGCALDCVEEQQRFKISGVVKWVYVLVIVALERVFEGTTTCMEWCIGCCEKASETVVDGGHVGDDQVLGIYCGGDDVVVMKRMPYCSDGVKSLWPSRRRGLRVSVTGVYGVEKMMSCARLAVVPVTGAEKMMSCERITVVLVYGAKKMYCECIAVVPLTD